MTNLRTRYAGVDELVPCLAEIMDRVSASKEAAIVKRRPQLMTSLRRLSRHAGLNPRVTPFIPPVMTTAFARITPSACGLSKKSIQNDRSNIRFLLDQFGLGGLRQYLVPLRGQYKKIYDRLGDRHVRSGISRLLRFAQVDGVALTEIDDSFAARFHRALVQEGVIKNPEASWRTALRNWNIVCVLFPDAGLAALTLPKRRSWGFPWGAFPDSLFAEVEAYFAKRGEAGDLFDPDAPDVMLRPRTIETQKDWLRTLASAAVRSGIDIESLDALQVLVHPHTVESAMRWHIERHKANRTDYIVMLVVQAVTVAKALKLSKADIERLQKLTRRLRQNVRRTRTEPLRLERLAQFESRDNVLKMLALSEHVACSISRKPGSPSSRDRLAFQMALVHELMLVTSLRRGNIAALDLERHLIWPDGPGGKRCLIRIPGTEVKNTEGLHKELPEHVIDLMRLYLARYRPDAPTSWLFPGRNGRHKKPSTLTTQYRTFIRDWTGLDVSPHLIRSFADKLYTDRHPEGGEVMRRQLGHRSPETRIAHYADPRSRAAGRAYQALLLEERDEALKHPALFESRKTRLRTGKGVLANPKRDQEGG